MTVGHVIDCIIVLIVGVRLVDGVVGEVDEEII